MVPFYPGAFAVSRNAANELIEVPNDIDGQIALLSSQNVATIMRKYKTDWTRPRADFDPHSSRGLTTKRIEGDYIITWGRQFGSSGLKSVYLEIAGMDSVEYLRYKPLDIIFTSLKKGTPVITVVPDKSLTPQKAAELGVPVMTYKEYYQLKFIQANVHVVVMTESELQQFGRAQNRAIDIVKNGKGFNSYFDWVKWLASSDRTGAELALMGLTSEQALSLASNFGIDASTTTINSLSLPVQFWFYCHEQSDQNHILLPAVDEDANSIVCNDYDWTAWSILVQSPPVNKMSVNAFAFLAFQIYVYQITNWAVKQNLGPAILQDGYQQIHSDYYQNQLEGVSIGFGDDFWDFIAGKMFPKRFQKF